MTERETANGNDTEATKAKKERMEKPPADDRERAPRKKRMTKKRERTEQMIQEFPDRNRARTPGKDVINI